MCVYSHDFLLIETMKQRLLGRGGLLLTCPYPLTVQAGPPRDQRPAFIILVINENYREEGFHTNPPGNLNLFNLGTFF